MADIIYADPISVYSSENTLTWYANHLPPKTRVYSFINGTPASSYTAPSSGIYGDPLITDELGNLSGSIIIPYNDVDKIPAGQIRISFVDNPDSIKTSKFLSESSFYTATPNDTNIDQGGFTSTREPTRLREVPENSLAAINYNDKDTVNYSTDTKLELLSQTFIVDSLKYPSGVYLSAVDLFFARKDDIFPISIEMKPCDDQGIPISSIFIPGTYKALDPTAINVTPLTNDLIDISSAGTTFEFDYPVYFKPGLYALTIRTNSDNYDLYSSRSGEILLNSVTTSENSTEKLVAINNTGYVNFLNTYGVWLASDPNFTVKQINNFKRVFYAPYTGNYFIKAMADNSITLFVDDNKVVEKNNIADWSNVINPQGTINATTISLQKGKHILSFNVTNSLEVAGFGVTIEDTMGSVIWDTKTYANGGTNSIYNKPFEGNDVSKTGALFKPSNITNRQPITNEDLCFVIKKARFRTGEGSFELYNTPVTDFETNTILGFDYDSINLASKNILLPGVHSINYTISHKSTSGDFSTFDPILTNDPFILNERKNVNNTNDLKIKVAVTNNDVNTTPVIDLDKFLAIAYQNEVDPYEVDLSTSELTPLMGESSARYISKPIVLLDGFDSTGLRVNLEVNRKTGTDIEVFAKVINAKDTTSLDNRPWQKLSLISNSGVKKFAGLNDGLFFEETYQLLEPTLEYSGNTVVGSSVVQSNFKDFNRYVIKVVFYSLNEPYIPKIKNLYATAIV